MTCAVAIGFAGALLGCSPNIGDSCKLHTDCSQTGTRVCDPTFPGGYCTIFGCSPGSCPSESVCVGFDTVVSSSSSESGCASPLDQRLARLSCMYACDSNSDCRSGYACVDFYQTNPYNAVIVELGSPPPRTKVCTVTVPPNTKVDMEPPHLSEVCDPPPLPAAVFSEAGASSSDGSPNASLPDAATSSEAGTADAGRDASARRDTGP